MADAEAQQGGTKEETKANSPKPDTEVAPPLIQSKSKLSAEVIILCDSMFCDWSRV